MTNEDATLKSLSSETARHMVRPRQLRGLTGDTSETIQMIGLTFLVQKPATCQYKISYATLSILFQIVLLFTSAFNFSPFVTQNQTLILIKILITYYYYFLIYLYT